MTKSPRRVRISVELPVHGIGFDRVRELACAAEEAGLDGVWVPDHLVPLRPDGPFPLECWTLLAALAGATSRIRVGPLVLVLPLRDPGLLALQARTLAAVAPGRVVLGIGLGGFTYRRAAESLGIATHDLTARGDALADALQRLRAALLARFRRTHFDHFFFDFFYFACVGLFDRLRRLVFDGAGQGDLIIFFIGFVGDEFGRHDIVIDRRFLFLCSDLCDLRGP